MREITVVIPNYNGKKYLCACLKALFDNTKTEMDVIVVDNASEDKSLEEAKQLFPEIRCIVLDKNYGFSRAVNEGIRASKTPYVILLNNDTQVEDGFVEELLRAVKRGVLKQVVIMSL